MVDLTQPISPKHQSNFTDTAILPQVHTSESPNYLSTTATGSDASMIKDEVNAGEGERHRREGWARWLAGDISTHSLVPTLVLQAFATGILDATTYADFLTFASNQTGNTILLCVAAIGTTTTGMARGEGGMEIARLILTAISLGTFLLCAGIFGHLGHFMGTRRRSWLLLTNFLQFILLFIALILLILPSTPDFHIGGSNEWLPLALFAGMSGAQVAQARQSGSAELPTAPMTSSYVDLVSDRHLFKGIRDPKAGPRNKRAIYVLVMILGGMLGAVIHRWAGTGAVVGATLGLKGLVTIWMGILKGEKKQKGSRGSEMKV